jgi:hypothetical protein
VRFGRDPADQRRADGRREQAVELGSGLLRAGEHDPRIPKRADGAVERLRDLPQMAVDDRLDVPLEARL